MQNYTIMRLGFLLAGMSLVQLAQGQNPAGTGAGAGNPASLSELNRVLLNKPVQGQDRSGIEGNPYLHADYTEGFVKLRNGQTLTSVPVRLELINNDLHYIDKNQEMTMLEVDSVAYMGSTEDNKKKQLTVLKTGYPAIDGHTANSYYQVLASGPRAHLLKYYTCTIRDEKRMGVPDKKVFSTESSMYIYVAATNSIKKVRLNKKDILDALQGVPDVEKMAEEQKTNFKKEADVKQLLDALNSR